MRKTILLLALVVMAPINLFAWERSYIDNSYQASFNKVTSIELYGWKSNLDGNLNVEGMNIDLDSDADMGTENRFGFRISHVLSEKSRLALSYMKNDHSGNVNRNVTFDGKVYKAGAAIDIENSWFDLTYAHNLSKGSSANRQGKMLESFYLDALLGVKFSDAEVNVAGNENTAAAAYLQDSWSETFPVPYIGLAGGGQLAKNLWLRGHLKYIKVNAGGNDALHHDYGINLALKLNPNSADTEWFVNLGYNNVKYDVDADNDSAELKYCGPTLGIIARF